MNEKALTPLESLAIITQMVNESRQRYAKPNLIISLIWATTAIATALTAFILYLFNENPLNNLVWIAIPLVGTPLSILASRKEKHSRGATKTYVENLDDWIWKSVIAIGVLMVLVCGAFNVAGYPIAWLSMFLYAFIVIGFGATMEGIVLREKSYLYGGIFSIVAGFAIIGMKLCNLDIPMQWLILLYIIALVAMFILPAIIIRHKLTQQPA